MIIHVFTEEQSAKNVFEVILPKVLPQNVQFRVYPHQGKQDLERALRKVVPSISKVPGSKILITRDQDSSDCTVVKNELNAIIKDNCHCPYFIRIICRELESWFLGDMDAIKHAFSRFNPDQYRSKAPFRNVDKISNPGTYLLRLIPEFSNRITLPKLETSETISPFLDIDNNRSASFQQTISAIKRLIEYEENRQVNN